jgi:hypothetical protein
LWGCAGAARLRCPLSRALTRARLPRPRSGTIAYAVPAYSTFKAVEKRGGEEVRDWAQYW